MPEIFPHFAMSAAVITGAWPAPSGVTPNFTNPEYIGRRIVIVALLCPAIAIPFVAMRLYTKRFIIERLHLDDYKIVLAVLFALAYSILQVVQTRNGSGVHIWDVPLYKFMRYMNLGIYGGITYSLSTLFTKTSILLLYLRLSHDYYFRVVIYMVMFIAVGYSLCGTFAFLYLCQPIRKLWDFTVPGKCVNISKVFLAGAALNAGTDLIMLLLPVWLLWPLHLPAGQKIGVTLILMTGSFVCAISITRLVMIPFRLGDKDCTWSYTPNLLWCIIEMYTGIICSCLPNLKAFAKHHFPNLFPDTDQPELRRSSSSGITYATGVTVGHTTPLSQSESIQLRMGGKEH
ncbi:hypothetical protein BKA61DRAFT_611860 [Leptodontidium sp. MPI-SDFR-AT-0119]|nr:hypothetical protein BKA61DRAFT_611860 [Leptodontidium sp. MPI-SDFR-AT-0119]